MEYPALDNWLVNELRSLLHPPPRLRHNPPHRRRMWHPRSSPPPSPPTTRHIILGNDIPLPPAHDHRCRILLPSVFVIRP